MENVDKGSEEGPLGTLLSEEGHLSVGSDRQANRCVRPHSVIDMLSVLEVGLQRPPVRAGVPFDN